MSKRVRREDAWKQVKVDGDTLEERREQRHEQLERYVSTMSEESRKGIMGLVTQWDADNGVRGVPTSESVVNVGQGTVRNIEVQAPDDAFQLDPIVKRTPEQRVEAMTKRLLHAEPAQQEIILQEIQSHYWKQGMPVTVSALREVAAHYLNRAERRGP